MKIIQSLSLCLVVLCYFSTNAISASKGPLDQAKTYYVAQTGKDSNEGSQRSPFQSIQQAAKIAKAGDTVLIGQGVYRETLSPRNSGIESKPISFKALGDGEVVISGNQILQNWQPLSDGSWKTKMDWDLGNENQLFCQGKMMTLARWPNDRDGKLMTADGAQIEEGSTNTQIKNQSFPDQFNSKDLKGATLWSVAGSRWSAWTRVVTGYNQKEKAIAIPELKGFWFGEIHSPASKKGGEFYISGKRALLDSPGEWYYDRKAQEIYFMPPRGKDPNQLKIETKKRLYGIDFHNKKHINFERIKLFAAAVRTQNIEHCHFSKITLLHPTHTAYIKSMFYPISGITLSGRHNSISNSELSYSLDGGIKVQGDDNQVVNCYIHDFNYFGANGRGIELNGDRNLISHNTLCRAGRSSMKLAGQENLIQHNDISHMGLMTHDTGCIHLGGQDGQNTIIRYNILRDTGGEENNTNAMYFDNFCQNFIVHDNISWNVPTSLRLNRPSNNIMVFNNTFSGMINNLYGPWERQGDQWGTMLVNNVALKETKRRGHSTEILVKEEVPLVSNYKNHKATIGDFLNTETLQLVKSPLIQESIISKGTAIDGIASSRKMNIGALDYSQALFKAGHDFKKPPRKVNYQNADHIHNRNHIINGGFSKNEKNWLPINAKPVRYKLHPGFNKNPGAAKRDSIHGISATLEKSESGIKQTIKTLKPNTKYYFSAYVRHGELSDTLFSVLNSKAEKISAKHSSSFAMKKGWRLVIVPFTSPKNAQVTVSIQNTKDKEVHVDNVGVIPAKFIDLSNISI